MSENPRPARLVPPGAILKRELDARGWTQKELATIMRRPPQAISEIVSGAKRITAETALELGRALGTSPEFWLNLESNFQLWQAQRKEKKSKADAIARKARLFSLAPVTELIKRGWIKNSTSIDELEREVCRFLGIADVSGEPALAASFRQSGARIPETSAQLAWVKRVEAVASRCKVGTYRHARLRDAVPELLRLARSPEESPRALDALLDLGVAVAVVKHLPRSFVDGVAFTRDDGTPVVGLSLRCDRLDSFWFTVMHEVAHLVAGHPGAHVDDFRATELSASEREANDLARGWLVPSESLQEFLSVHRRLSKAVVVGFSETIERHPSIVVGQLQHNGVVPWTHFRELLPRVSPHLERWITP